MDLNEHEGVLAEGISTTGSGFFFSSDPLFLISTILPSNWLNRFQLPGERVPDSMSGYFVDPYMYALTTFVTDDCLTGTRAEELDDHCHIN